MNNNFIFVVDMEEDVVCDMNEIGVAGFVYMARQHLFTL